jgi:predicted DCC family thiol-disulfide oxidoreductase YuxK
MDQVSPQQFSLFRMFIGGYLFQHFLFLLPDASALFSNEGMLPVASDLPTYLIFPNILTLSDSPFFVTAFVALLGVSSCCLALGWQRRVIAVFLWYGWACLVNRNIFVSSPGMSYVGWILLVLAALPSGEPWSLDGKKNPNLHFKFPAVYFAVAWVLLATSYSLSGFAKAQTPSWQNGTALWHILQSAVARDSYFTAFLLMLPESILKILTWTFLGLESAFVFWSFRRRSRLWIWSILLAVQCFWFLAIDVPDTFWGMVMIHLFTFDQGWFKPVTLSENKQILFFDGVCGLCNRVVDFLMSVSSGPELKFAPLQGSTAKKLLPPAYTETLDTLVYYRDGKLWTKADAVGRILEDLGGVWSTAIVMRILPGFISNLSYDLVATNRYKLFGKKDSCRMPTADERARFLP